MNLKEEKKKRRRNEDTNLPERHHVHIKQAE